MDLHAARLQDWRSRDGYEAVVFHVARRPVADPAGPVTPDPSSVLPVRAHRRNLTLREKAASGGVYVAGALVWLLPVELLPAGFKCKPADFLADKEGAEHVVQAAQLNNYRTQWRLETLDLALAHDLRDTVDIQRATITYDAAGVPVKSFPPDGWNAATMNKGQPPPTGSVLYGALPARVQQLSEETEDTRGIRAFKGSYAVYVGRQVAVTFEDRVSWFDPSGTQRYFDIKAVHNASRIDELPVLDCELAP